MSNIFFRFYAGMLIVLCVICLSVYSITLVIDRYRFEHFIKSNSAGVSLLLSDILARRTHEEQDQWLILLNKLSGSKLGFSNAQSLNLSADELISIKRHGIAYRLKFSEVSSQFFIAVAGRENEYVVANLSNINDQIGRTLMLIVMSEMRYRNIRVEGTQFEQLKQRLNLPLSIMKIDDTILNYAQARLIKRNEMVVLMSDKLGQGASVTVYAPLERGGDALLKLGEVKRFIWMPVGLAFLLIFSSLLILALVAYLLILPIDRRVKNLTGQIAALDGDDQGRVKLSGNDELSKLAHCVDEMAQRILGLLAAQQEMTSAVSHELRTPIARMKFQLAFFEDIADGRFDKQVTGLKQDILELEQLVDEILTYASIKASKPNVILDTVNIVQLLSQAISRTADLNRHAASLKITLDDALPSSDVFADEHFIMRAIMNILTNAQRHANQAINIHVWQDDSEIYIKIEDDGEGVSEPFKHSVFKAFSSGDKSRSKASSGYGLGLAIVYQIMLWHRGSVVVEDSELGGAAFILSWPLKNK